MDFVPARGWKAVFQIARHCHFKVMIGQKVWSSKISTKKHTELSLQLVLKRIEVDSCAEQTVWSWSVRRISGLRVIVVGVKPTMESLWVCSFTRVICNSKRKPRGIRFPRTLSALGWKLMFFALWPPLHLAKSYSGVDQCFYQSARFHVALNLETVFVFKNYCVISSHKRVDFLPNRNCSSFQDGK